MVRPKNLAQKRSKNLNNGKNNYKNIATSPIPQKKTEDSEKFFNFDIRKIVLATLASGYTYITAFLFLSLLTGYIINKKDFYKTQSEFGKLIDDESQVQLKNIQHSLKNNIIIGIDGAWNHVRQASCCIVTMIDIMTNKIIDYEIVELPKQYVKGNANTASKNLEAIGVRRLAMRWKDDKRIVGYVHDNDGTTRKIFRDLGWKINEYLDYGHSIKATSRIVRNFVNKNPEFEEIGISLGKWLISILKSNYSSDYKLQLLLNSFLHYNNAHTFCKHTKFYFKKYTFSEKSIEKHKFFFKKTSSYGYKVNSMITSQAVESFNAFKSHFAQKSLKFATSTKIRYQIASLFWNDKTWPFDFTHNRLNLNENNEYVKQLYKNLVEPDCKKISLYKRF